MHFAIGRVATILALCFSLGFHWLALQSVAWTTMLVANARHAPLCEAVAKTFDGNHPCSLCHAVETGKKSEKESELPPTIAKMDLICTMRSVSFLPPWAPYTYAPLGCTILQQSNAPPVPPPRSLIA